MTYTGGMMVPEQRSTAVNAATFAVSTGERDQSVRLRSDAFHQRGRQSRLADAAA